MDGMPFWAGILISAPLIIACVLGTVCAPLALIIWIMWRRHVPRSIILPVSLCIGLALSAVLALNVLSW
jgi:hypothetical protein